MDLKMKRSFTQTEPWAIGLLAGLFILILAAVALSLHPSTPSSGLRDSTAPDASDYCPNP